MSNTKISIIIVNYNSSDNTKSLIKSLRLISKVIGEIIIVDNNSDSFSPNQFPKSKKYTFIENRSNLGFAKAVNLGINKSKNPSILLLNPDSKIIDNKILILLKELEKDSMTGAIGGEIISNNQKFSANTKPTFLTALFEFTNLKKIFPNNIFSTNFWPEKKNPHKRIEVDSLCGAFILFKKTLGSTQLKFDENFFLYLEDVDFGLLIRSLGYKVIFNPIAKIIHIGGESNESKYKIVLKHWYRSRKYFFKKHLNIFEGIIITIIFKFEENLLSLYHHLTHTPNE